jgi:hypothetical protein
MATKKITLNELRSLVRKIISEEIAPASVTPVQQTNQPQNNSNQDAGKFMNTIFTTTKALGITQLNMNDTDADTKRYTAIWEKEGFQPNTHGIIGVQKIANGAAVSLLIMTDYKAKLDKVLDVIDNAKGNIPVKINRNATYKIQNITKDKEAFVNRFNFQFQPYLNK